MDANGENKKVKKKAEEEFLHIIDVNKILCETGLDLDGLCKLVKLDSQTINRWGCKKSKNGNRPKYNAAVRLFRAGATVETLYGVEYKRPSPPPTAEKSQDQITPTDLSWAFGEAMKLLQEKKAPPPGIDKPNQRPAPRQTSRGPPPPQPTAPTDEPRPDQPKEVFTPPLESYTISKRENTKDRAVFIGDPYHPTPPHTK